MLDMDKTLLDQLKMEEIGSIDAMQQDDNE
jgi:hypothetical protein